MLYCGDHADQCARSAHKREQLDKLRRYCSGELVAGRRTEWFGQVAYRIVLYTARRRFSPFKKKKN